MTIPLFISHFLNIVWLLIPFRQVKTSFFFFFMLLALSSAILLMETLSLIISNHPANIYLGQGFFLIISLYNFKKIPHYILFLSGVLIISIILPFLLSIGTMIFCLIIEHLTIFFIILKRTVLYSVRQEKLNLFHFILLLFEISVITRFIVVAGNLETGIIFFYLSAAFSILIGIFFLLYNEENSPKFRLGNKNIIDLE